MKWKFFLVLFLNVTALASTVAENPPSTIWSYFTKLFSYDDQSQPISSGSVNAAVLENDLQDIHLEDKNNGNNNHNENQNLVNTDNENHEEKEEIFQQETQKNSLKVLNNTEIELILQDVEQFIANEKYADAINNLLTILEINPTHQKANSLIGSCFLTIDQSNVAENFLYTAISESNFTDFHAILNFIESLKLNEKYEIAISFILHLKSFPEEIIQNFEDSYYSLNYLIGTIYEYQKDYSMAQEWYLSAALKNPTNGNNVAATWLRASTILFPLNEKNLTLAESILLQAIKYNPLNTELIFNLGSLLHATNRILEAKILYEETLRLNPNMTSALANLATILHTIGDLIEAKEYYEKAIFYSTNNSVLLANYALCLSNLKFYSAAYDAIVKASLLDPDDVMIQIDKKKLDLLLQNMKQTKENLLKNIYQLFLNRQFDEILNHLISYGEPVEDGAWWYYTMGIVEYFRKQDDNAIQYCHKAKDALLSVTKTRALEGETDAGAATATAAEADHQHQSILINSCLGLAYQSKGMYSNANQYFEQSYHQLMSRSSSSPSSSSHERSEMMSYFIFNNLTENENDIKFNLLQSYSMNSQYDKCLMASCEIFQLPSVTSGGMIVLAFSYVQWSTEGQEKINLYQKEQEQQQEEEGPQFKNKIQIRAGKLLSEEVSI
jgi:tetratricopeptide (TPR) repeat protein